MRESEKRERDRQRGRERDRGRKGKRERDRKTERERDSQKLVCPFGCNKIFWTLFGFIVNNIPNPFKYMHIHSHTLTRKKI